MTLLVDNDAENPTEIVDKVRRNSFFELASKRRQSLKLSDVSIEKEMDFYDGRYFLINKTLMLVIGLWPYQSKTIKTLIRVFVTICIVIPTIPQIIRMIVFNKNLEIQVQCVGTLCYFFLMIVKYHAMLISEEKFRKLYKYIVANWRMLETDDERIIMEKHSEIGRLLTVGYVGYMFNAGIGFICLPISPRLINTIFNRSITEMFILDGEYLIDKQEYYYDIYFFETCCITISVVVFSTVDSTYAVCVQQCVGLYSVIVLRLKLATQEQTGYQTHDASYHAIAKAIALHEEVLKLSMNSYSDCYLQPQSCQYKNSYLKFRFGRVLESSFSTSFLFVMASSTTTVVALAVSILYNLNNPVLFIRYVAIMIGCAIHLFYLSWPGQKLIDASDEIFFAAYNNEWYECSIKSQQLLKLIMRRTIEPFCLTAGGFYVMNFANFQMLMKTAMSYITVLASFK